MLLDVTAFHSASSTLGIVAGAFVVSENSQIVAQSSLLAPVASTASTASQTAWRQALDAVAVRSTPGSVDLALASTTLASTTLTSTTPASTTLASNTLASTTLAAPTLAAPTVTDPVTGPRPATVRVSAAKLPGLRGVELFDQLALLDGSQLSKLVSAHPDTIAALIKNPPAAATLTARWAGLTSAQQHRLVSQAPELVGSLEGLPYADRDAANRSFLTSAELGIREQLAADGVGRAAKDQLSKRLHMLEQVRSALRTGDSGNTRSLISLDTTGEGRAVIVVGDPSTADYVDYLIPGMFSDVDTQIQVLAGGADSIATQQQAWLKKLNPGVPASQLPTVATFAWIGYQTPNIVNVASMSLAREGQKSLTKSIEGLRAERAARVTTTADGVVAGAQPYVAILAHSYGSTAAMLSLAEDQVSVDALAVVGSPGSPARTAGQLNVTNGNVWVGAGDTDPVPQTGLFGSQPTSTAYGAHRFGVNGAVDPVSGAELDAVVGHDGYFAPDTESLRNMVLIGIGRGDLVLGLNGQAALSLGRAHGTVPRGPQL